MEFLMGKQLREEFAVVHIAGTQAEEEEVLSVEGISNPKSPLQQCKTVF